ncbi:hypothetical protein, partial [Streptomyces sp. RTd22]|uniref:hypothetical protein n=1 Tax=Streptomyces sp. RTd22 TaxID=1841249 RepID=UPI001F452769
SSLRSLWGLLPTMLRRIHAGQHNNHAVRQLAAELASSRFSPLSPNWRSNASREALPQVTALHKWGGGLEPQPETHLTCGFAGEPDISIPFDPAESPSIPLDPAR